MAIRPRLLLALAVTLAALPLCMVSCTQSDPSSTAGAGPVTAAPTIKDTYKGHFLIGTAGDVPGGFSDEELHLIKQNFNIITPENYLKPAPVHPLEDVWAFTRTDALIKWCSENNVAVHGHTLMWHSQTAGWFFQGGDRDTIIKRLKDHIMTLVGRYKGKIHSWDVVNEAINDGNGAPDSENLRNSQWLQAIGPEFLTMAFKFAHEADPNALLYYNDYNIESGGKHASSMVLLRRLIKDGAPINGVGIQGHWSTNGLPYAALDKAISDYASLGLKVSISELDVTIAGASGGQLGPGAPGAAPGAGATPGGAPGFGRGRGRGAPPASGPATAPTTNPPSAFLLDGEPLYFTAAPGAGRGPGRGPAAQPLVNPIDTIATTVADLSDTQKESLVPVASDVAARIAQWQRSSQVALLSMQPQYTPGQVAYQHELEEYTAEQAKQNVLRDDIFNDGEARAATILTPAQVEKWQSARLTAQVGSQFAALTLTDEQKAKADALIAQTAKKLATLKEKAAVTAAKADFSKSLLGVLDQTQLTQLQSAGNRGGPGRGFGRGGGGARPSEAALKTQADAYARIFVIFEKHKDSMDRITFWGLNDARSWRSGQNPLLFDAQNKQKPAYQAIIDALVSPSSVPAVPGVNP